MLDTRFYDQALGGIENGQAAAMLPLIAGKLYAAYADQAGWASAKAALRDHPLHRVLLEDPFASRAARKPRGYAGDAELIDFAYDRDPPTAASSRGKELFSITTSFQAPEGVRRRRDYAERRLSDAWVAGKKICALACGHLREADPLIGADVSNIVAVDQDPLSLAIVKQNHGDRITTVEANAIHYLRAASKATEKFDFIYTLGMTDYFDTRAMSLLYRLMKDSLAPGGEILVANFLPDHLGVGWMDAVMDWHLIYRDEADMARHAAEIGMQARSFRDETGSIIFCELTSE